MSCYLSCVLTFDSDTESHQFAKLIIRATRPLFVEDVESADIDFFNIIKSIEYPDEIKINDNCLALDWKAKDRFDFVHLKPIFQLENIKLLLAHENIKLLLAHEKDSYLGSGDGDEDLNGRYWFFRNGKINCCNAKELPKKKYKKALNFMRQLDC